MTIKGQSPGFETPATWFPIIVSCLRELDELPVELTVGQIKEKYGQLRIYIDMSEEESDKYFSDDDNLVWPLDEAEEIIERYTRLLSWAEGYNITL